MSKLDSTATHTYAQKLDWYIRDCLSVYHYKPYSTPDPHTVTQVPFKAHSPEMLAGSSKNVWLSGDEFLKSDISATVRLTFVVWTDLVDEF